MRITSQRKPALFKLARAGKCRMKTAGDLSKPTQLNSPVGGSQAQAAQLRRTWTPHPVCIPTATGNPTTCTLYYLREEPRVQNACQLVQTSKLFYSIVIFGGMCTL